MCSSTSTRTSTLLCAPLAALLLLVTTTQAQAQQPRRVASKLLTSRRAVEAALGKDVARQVPSSFDFQLFSLAWVKLPAVATPRVKIVTLPAERKLRYTHSSARWVDIVRERKVLRLNIFNDGPCSGGPARPQKEQQRCYDRLRVELAEAKKTLALFATPRAKLKRVVATERPTLPRP